MFRDFDINLVQADCSIKACHIYFFLYFRFRSFLTDHVIKNVFYNQHIDASNIVSQYLILIIFIFIRSLIKDLHQIFMCCFHVRDVELIDTVV